ncbi:hypothetical protein [Salinigranum halophilum]|uniref:hypothetical protein n=1 Tax=Salinigranum halophilum TaxID=2565931 RepID=UPI0010A81684|nr:hypothetical protein [Salinigranum halophilum]
MSTEEFESSKPPRDVSIEKSKLGLYKELQENDDSPFYDAEANKIFLFAMAYGTKKTGRTPLTGERHALFNVSTYNEDIHWIIKSIAAREKRATDVLVDGKEVFKIAMEYANGGIDELHGKVFAPGDALIELSDELIEIAEEMDD